MVLYENRENAANWSAKMIRLIFLIRSKKLMLFFIIRIKIDSITKKFLKLFSNKKYIDHAPNNFEMRSGCKVAIFAMYPTSDELYQKSATNLIDGLIANGLHVLVVSNRAIPTELENEISKRECDFILRKNVGRDFGAYQTGILWLYENGLIDKCEMLLMANDTMLWLESSEQIVTECIKHTWSSLFLNFEVHTHAQSFFMSFSKEVLRNPEFMKFWKQYLPLNYRRYAIRNGEVKLTTTLIEQGFTCKAYVNSNLIEKASNQTYDEPFVRDYLGSTRIGRAIWSEVFAVQNSMSIQESIDEQGWAYSQNLNDGRVVNDIVALAFRIIGRYCYLQAPHRIGLHLYLLLGVPLKTDLYKCYPVSEISRCVKYRDPLYASLVDDFYSKKSQQFMSGSRLVKRKRMLDEI